MSEKNSSVNLKNGFKDLKDLSNIFQNFKNKLDNLNKEELFSCSLRRARQSCFSSFVKAYSFLKKSKFHYVLIDHNLRKNQVKRGEKS